MYFSFSQSMTTVHPSPESNASSMGRVRQVSQVSSCSQPSLPARSESFSSSSRSSFSSYSSIYSTKSSLRFGGFSENTVVGFKQFSEIKVAFFGTDWKFNKYDLLKAYTLVSKYHAEVRQL